MLRGEEKIKMTLQRRPTQAITPATKKKNDLQRQCMRMTLPLHVSQIRLQMGLKCI